MKGALRAVHPPRLRRLVGRSDISVDGESPSTVERPTTLHHSNRNARCVARNYEITLHDDNTVPNRVVMCEHDLYHTYVAYSLTSFLLMASDGLPVPSRFGALPTSLEYQPHELVSASVSGTSFDQTKT